MAATAQWNSFIIVVSAREYEEAASGLQRLSNQGETNTKVPAGSKKKSEVE